MTTLYCVCGSRHGLNPTELAPGLPALTCQDCHGHLLRLDDYRHWIAHEAGAGYVPVPVSGEMADGANKSVRRCPVCTHFMERLLSGHAVDFRVDRCTGCQLLWMDKGEWNALVEAGFGKTLLELLSDAGQLQLRHAANHRRHEADLRARHGDAVVDELIRMRAWLAAQPQADTLLALLRHGW